jgi:hypothetical protein
MPTPLITSAIPEQGFEKVRDAIGIILLTELTNQKALQAFTEDINIYRERIIPMQSDDNLYFNVLTDSATYGNYTQRDAQGRTIYFIDIYTTGKGANVLAGSLDAGVRLGKFIGLVQFILGSNQYKTLGLPLGLIGGTYIESFTTDAPTPFETANYDRFARISFAVRIQENYGLWNGVNLIGNDSTVKVEPTEKGYQYTFTNV